MMFEIFAVFQHRNEKNNDKNFMLTREFEPTTKVVDKPPLYQLIYGGLLVLKLVITIYISV